MSSRAGDPHPDPELALAWSRHALARILAVVAPGHRLCRICGGEWSSLMSPDHVSGCPLGSRS